MIRRRIQVERWDAPESDDDAIEHRDAYISAYVNQDTFPTYIEIENPDGSGWAIMLPELMRLLRDLQ